MEIPVKVKVFPDPDFCLDKDRQCRFMFRHYNSYRCTIFFDENDENEVVGQLNEISEKCLRCRETYQKEEARLNKNTVVQRFSEKTGALHFMKTTVGEEEAYQKQKKLDNKSPGNCMHCSEPITPENDGISINEGEFFQCDDCHEIEFGARLWTKTLYFYSKNL